MTKIKNILSMEETIRLSEIKEEAKKLEVPMLVKRNAAIMSRMAENNTEELTDNIKIEFKLEIQEILDSFKEVMFNIADNIVATEKR